MFHGFYPNLVLAPVSIMIIPTNPGGCTGMSMKKEADMAAQSTVILINRKGMGEADPELQTTLI